MAKQPIKKQNFVKPDKTSFMADFKKQNGLEVTEENYEMTQADKPLDWIVLPEAIQNAVKLPGFPRGYTSLITGWSNTGKSTVKYMAIAAAQKQGILPIVYETENHFDWGHAIECGVEATPVYGNVEEVDEETGEVMKINKIIDYDGFILVMDSTILANKYGNMNYSTGKPEAKNRGMAVIEDIAYSVNDFIDQQREGKIPYDLCFIWDSVGSVGSFKSFSSKSGNNMFDAGAISQAFNTILNDTIPSSKKMSSKYTNTFIAINKIWNDGMNAGPTGVSIEYKGGKTFYYGSRLIVHLGGKKKSAIQKLNAVYKGSKVNYATITKIGVEKNHLPTPYNTTYEGEFVITHNGAIENTKEALDNYKKEYLAYLITGKDSEKINEAEVEFSQEEIDI